MVTICIDRPLSVLGLSYLTSGISTYRSATSILCAWSFFGNISLELSQAYFIFRPSSNSSKCMFYHSLITQGFAILSGLKMNSSYQVDVAVGFPTSKLLWPIIQPIQSMKLSTQDTSEFELFDFRFFRLPCSHRATHKLYLGKPFSETKTCFFLVTKSPCHSVSHLK